jgi:hypothetical protein
MALAQLDKLMHENFLVVTEVRKLPESVKASFCNIEQCNLVGVKFDMVNPGETMSTDYIIPGVPNKQLRFAALNSDSAIVFYERGGYASQLCVAFRHDGPIPLSPGTPTAFAPDRTGTGFQTPKPIKHGGAPVESPASYANARRPIPG